MAGVRGRTGLGGMLQPREQVPIALVLTLPIAVDRDKLARGAATPEVEPLDVFALLIERDTDRDLELLLAAGAGTLLQLGIGDVLAAVADGMLDRAGRAPPDGRPFGVVEQQPKDFVAAPTNCVGEVVSDTEVALAVQPDLLAEISLALAVALFSSLPQRHSARPLPPNVSASSCKLAAEFSSDSTPPIARPVRQL